MPILSDFQAPWWRPYRHDVMRSQHSNSSNPLLLLAVNNQTVVYSGVASIVRLTTDHQSMCCQPSLTIHCLDPAQCGSVMLSGRTWRISCSVRDLTAETGTMITVMVSPTALNTSRA